MILIKKGNSFEQVLMDRSILIVLMSIFYSKNSFYRTKVAGSLWLVLFFVNYQSLCCQTVNPYPPGRVPNRVNLTVTDDPSTSMSVSWRTDPSVNTSFAEIVEANDDPGSVKDALRLNAITKVLVSKHGSYKTLQWEGVAANYHSVTFRDLKPNTLYTYRVGDGDHWSEWFQFMTAGISGDKLSFLYFGDAQTDLLSMWAKVIRKAYAQEPGAELMVHAGDLVNRAERDEEWGEWFEAGSFVHATIPNMPSPGNHDYGRGENEMELSPFWRPQFTLPDNGPDGLEETCYFTDVQGVRFISLDSYMVEESDEYLRKQKMWMENVLKTNPGKWTVVVFHHPIFSPKSTRDNKRMRDTFTPLFDRYKVDLVLQGHDHTYARGMSKIPMQRKGDRSGTMYVVSVSGPKMAGSGVAPKSWMDRSALNTQLYNVISILDDKLEFRAYTVTGKLFDAFDLLKQNGSINKFVEQMPVLAN